MMLDVNRINMRRGEQRKACGSTDDAGSEAGKEEGMNSFILPVADDGRKSRYCTSKEGGLINPKVISG
jgi:hypothetical protein